MYFCDRKGFERNERNRSEHKAIVKLNVVIRSLNYADHTREDFSKCKTHSRIIKFSNGIRQFVDPISEIYLTIKTLVTLEESREKCIRV